MFSSASSRDVVVVADPEAAREVLAAAEADMAKPGSLCRSFADVRAKGQGRKGGQRRGSAGVRGGLLAAADADMAKPGPLCRSFADVRAKGECREGRMEVGGSAGRGVALTSNVHRGYRGVI